MKYAIGRDVVWIRLGARSRFWKFVTDAYATSLNRPSIVTSGIATIK